MSTEDKQTLLRREIIDRNYDPESFEMFVTTIKPDCGEDIDKWTIEELSKTFKHLTIKESTIKLFQDQNDNLQQQDRKLNPLNKSQSDQQDLILNLQCREVQKTVLGDTQNLNIKIIGFTKQEGGFFYSSYINYTIETTPLNWSVCRRYNDFYWLKDALQKLYPFIAIPPIPFAKQRSFQEDYLNKRMRFAEKFLNNLLCHEVLKNDYYVLTFLSLNEKEFQLVKRSSVAPGVISNILMGSADTRKLEDNVTVDGSLQSAINDNINSYIDRSSEAINEYDVLYKKLRQASKQLTQQQNAVTKTLYDIGEIFGQFFSTANVFNKKVEFKNYAFEETFITLNNMMITWGNVINSEIKQNDNSLSNFFKFYHHQTRDLRQIIKQRNTQYDMYTEKSKKLTERKIKLYSDPSRWDLTQQQIDDLIGKDRTQVMSQMLPKETLVVEKNKILYGIYNSQACSEIQRVLQNQVDIFSSHFTQFCEQQANSISQSHILWVDTLTNLKCKGLKNHNLMQQRQNQVEDVIIEGLDP